MELDRGSIERRNFQTARRGYEPTEVDAHLRSVADAVEQMREDTQRQQQEQRTTLSSAAAERVRLILDAAETSAEGIEAAAQQEADQIIADARRQGEEAQRRAQEEAAEHVENVERQATLLNQRADRLQSEFDSVLERLRGAAGQLIDGLRSEGGDLRSDLDSLKRELEEARGSRSLGVGTADAEPMPAAPSAAASDFDGGADDNWADDEDLDGGGATVVEPEIASEPMLDAEPVAAEPELEEAAAFDQPSAVEEPAAGEAEPGDAGAGESGGAEGARLIALNMALNGTPREETAEYLERTFGLRNERLLDDVYERVQRS